VTVCPDGWSPPRRRWLRRGGGEQNPAYRPTRPPPGSAAYFGPPVRSQSAGEDANITVGEFRDVMADIARLAAKRGLALEITEDPVTGEALYGVR
jgi:hypothetical protein